jgi:hypothetical protein
VIKKAVFAVKDSAPVHLAVGEVDRLGHCENVGPEYQVELRLRNMLYVQEM